MERAAAEQLFEGFSQHPIIKGLHPNSEIFLPLLKRKYMSDSSRFSEELPEKDQPIIESSEVYHKLSLRRVIRNRNAKKHEIGRVKAKAIRVISHIPFVYSSVNFARDLRTHPELIDLMDRCEYDFSVLGKVATYDSSGGENSSMIRTTRPILIIPSVDDMDKVLAWEGKEAYPERERAITHSFTRSGAEKRCG